MAAPSGQQKSAFDHAWRYFELHAAQRLSLFNFFTALASVNLAGLGATFLANRALSPLGALLGLVLALLSFVFWKLDQRVSFLVKHGEEALSGLEQAVVVQEGRLFGSEPAKTAHPANRSGWRGIWTYGRAFRVTFVAMAAIGFVGSTLSVLRFADVISLEAPKDSTAAKPDAAPVAAPRPEGSPTRQAQPTAPSKPGRHG